MNTAAQIATIRIVSKLRALIGRPAAGVTANPRLARESFRIDGATGATCVVVEVSPAGIILEMRGTTAHAKRVNAPKGLTFAALAMMIEFAADGALV